MVPAIVRQKLLRERRCNGPKCRPALSRQQRRQHSGVRAVSRLIEEGKRHNAGVRREIR
jgi:hypothetical protein